MGFLTVSLGNSANWQLSVQQTLTAQSSAPNTFLPIPSYTSPIQFTSPIIAIYANSESVTEPYAGWVIQNYLIGINNPPTPNAISQNRFKLYQGGLQLFTFLPIITSYTITLAPPSWYQDISYSIWEYIGSVTDSTENLINNSVIPKLG